MRLLLALLAFIFLTAAREPILVPEISPNQVEVRQTFTGAELLLFGAILDPQGNRAGRDFDIVVVIKGPTGPILLREKRRIAGIWINAGSTEFLSAPTYFAVASTRPISQIVDDKTAAIYELGLPWLQLSPGGTIEPKRLERYSQGLVDLMGRKDLFQENEGGVKLSEQVLYQARIKLPSNVQTGQYTAETFAISRGRVVASRIIPVNVEKVGFEGAVAQFARDYGFLYGLLTVGLSVFLGWLAGRVFALI